MAKKDDRREHQRAVNRKCDAAHPERVEAYNRRYYAANRERLKAKQRQWYAVNRARALATQRKYYDANREYYTTWNRAYYHVNRDRMRANNRAWCMRNKETVRTGTGYRKMLIAMLVERDGNACFVCQSPVDAAEAWVEHRVPLAAGGDLFSAPNLGISHRRCNNRRAWAPRFYGQPERDVRWRAKKNG